MQQPLINCKIETDTKNNSRLPARKIVITSALILFFLACISVFLLSVFRPNSNSLTTSSSTETRTVSESSSYYKSDYADDLITNMHALVKDSCIGYEKECYQTEQYSGYLLANNQREMHYWFIQASVDDYLQRPLFIWTNGGPGCSGMEGMLEEHGPWTIYESNRVHYNQYSWNTEVNMLYIEQPYGVGFSVAEDDDVVAGDQYAAEDMDAMIRNFLVKFPQFADNEVYLTSESWGGHYVPMTTATIMLNNLQATPTINLKGFLLGNPYTNEYENAYGWVGGLYAHGLVPEHDYQGWRHECWDNEKNMDDLELCSAIYVRSYRAASNIDFYALDFPNCKRDESWDQLVAGKDALMSRASFIKASHIHRQASKHITNLLRLTDEQYEQLDVGIPKQELVAYQNRLQKRGSDKFDEFAVEDIVALEKSDSEAAHYVLCSAYHLHYYLNEDAVQEMLNVKTTKWKMCSNAVYNAWPETDYERWMQQVYVDLVATYPGELKMMVYSGDDDSVCGLEGTAYWLDRMDEWQVDSDNLWQAWEDSDQQLGGYYTRYLDGDGNTALHFATVHTAGHMVPSCQPRRSLDLLKKFLYEY